MGRSLRRPVPVSGVRMVDQAADGAEQSPESLLLGAGFSRRLEWWVPPGEDRALSLEGAVAALDAGEVKPAGLEIPAFPDQPGFRELTPEAIDALADRLFRPPPPPWLEPLAELVADKLRPVVRSEVGAALKGGGRV
jgi:hypothetical protein